MAFILNKIRKKNLWWYNCAQIEDFLREDVAKDGGSVSFSLLYDTFPKRELRMLEEEDTWMEAKDMADFLDYVWDVMQSEKGKATAVQIKNCIKSGFVYRRTESRRLKWLVAYSQNYKCNSCGVILHPLEFECDHKTELQSGGEDELQNLQCLCSCCHSRKTRSHHYSPKRKIDLVKADELRRQRVALLSAKVKLEKEIKIQPRGKKTSKYF